MYDFKILQVKEATGDQVTQPQEVANLRKVTNNNMLYREVLDVRRTGKFEIDTKIAEKDPFLLERRNFSQGQGTIPQDSGIVQPLAARMGEGHGWPES